MRRRADVRGVKEGCLFVGFVVVSVDILIHVCTSLQP